MISSVTVKRTSRLLSGHLWVFSNEIQENLLNYEPGSIVKVFDRYKNFYGVGYINPHSLITIRLLTHQDEPIDGEFFRKCLTRAYTYRKSLIEGQQTYRLIYSEGDLLPGLIIDVYGKVFVLQCLTYGIERLSEVIIEVIEEMFKPEAIVLRNDSPSRRLEGLELYKQVVRGNISKIPVIQEGGINMEVDPVEGQKTGAFLDQRLNRIAFASLIKEGSIGLDLFCYNGGWGIHTLKKASMVTFVDESQRAIDCAVRNVSLNKLRGTAQFVKADVFDFLKRCSQEGKSYDFIILDPPAFAKNKAHIKEAMRAYRELNSMAIGLLRVGGLLATSSCSHHISKEVFLELIARAAAVQRRRLRIVEQRTQAADHPILLNMPETEYLKCLFLEAID